MNLERLRLTSEEVAAALVAAYTDSLPESAWQRVAVGFYLRCARLLTALVSLSKAGLEDCGEGLTRSIMEHAATAGWVLSDPKRLDALMGAYARQWRIILEEGPPTNVDLTEEELEMIAVPEEQLPRMRERLEACGLGQYYSMYRGLSDKAHGTLVAASAGLGSRYSPGTYLSVGSHFACHVGVQVSESLGWGIEGYLRGLEEQ
jgi:hypothetical protein